VSDLDILIDEYVDKVLCAEETPGDDVEFRRLMRDILGRFAYNILKDVHKYAR
jgi:hypothetical protein